MPASVKNRQTGCLVSFTNLASCQIIKCKTSKHSVENQNFKTEKRNKKKKKKKEKESAKSKNLTMKKQTL